MKAVYEDFKGKKYVDVAKKAQSFGICTTRNIDALAQHISVLVNQKESEAEEEKLYSKDNIESTLVLNNIEKMLNERTAKYESLLSAILDTANYSESGSIFLDIKAIRRWLYVNEPERVLARVESLQLKG